MEHSLALPIAQRLVKLIEPYCERAEIAGSVRRGKPDVHDIEIVCRPKFTFVTNLLGELVEYCPFYNWLFSHPDMIGKLIKGGAKYRQYALPEGINLDMFIVTPPAEWGVIMTIRTGPEDFSKWIVTRRREGGGLPSYMQVKDGVLFNTQTGKIESTPEEIDFLNKIGLGWIEPGKRRPRW
jgi:DNA polymerase/3'-5' exonuclease PolX